MMAELTASTTEVRSRGMDELQLANALSGQDATSVQTGFTGSGRYQAIIGALIELKRESLVEHLTDWWRIKSLGELALRDLRIHHLALGDMVKDVFTAERTQVLDVLNRLSPREAEDHALLEWVTYRDVLSDLRWEEGVRLLEPVARELEEHNLLVRDPTDSRLRATYRGLIWTTRRERVLAESFIDSLVAEWETTNVEFKREVHTDTASDKAELIKDILALSNTQVTARRWLIIGFDPRTHAYYGPPDPKITQDHIEQLLGAYVRPVPPVEYRVVSYRAGPVGQLEVRRDRRDVPYQVKKALGDKAARDKRIEVGDVFVRHNSQSVRADQKEIDVLREEAARVLAADHADTQ
jgi:hypothetical protein